MALTEWATSSAASPRRPSTASSRRRSCAWRRGLALAEIPIRDLPLYSYDYDADYPAPARAYKQALEDAQALLFVTPEYNRGIRAPSRRNRLGQPPEEANAFVHKPSAVIGTSEGKIDTAVAQRELHSVLGAVASPQMVSPEAYIQFTPTLIDDEGNVADEKVKAFLSKFMPLSRSSWTSNSHERGWRHLEDDRLPRRHHRN